MATSLASDNVNSAGSIQTVGRTSTVISLVGLCLVKGIEEALLPCSFRAIESDLGLSPSHLGFLALCQGVACAITGPVWGALIDCGASRKRTLQVGAMGWSLCCCLLAFVTDFKWMCAIRFFNGICLAMMVPTLMPMVSALTTDGERGAMFGLVEFAAGHGRILAFFFVLPITHQTVFGMRGWQFALLSVGICCAVAACMLQYTIHEEPQTWHGHKFSVYREIRKVFEYLSIPSFSVIVLQGMFGTIPMAAKHFTVMYLGYMGVSHFVIGLLLTLSAVGDTTGGFLGGFIGDVWEKQSPNRGRIYTALVSLTFGMFFLYMIYGFAGEAYSTDAHMFVKVMAGLMFLDGLTSSWTVPGCLNPTLIAIIPERRVASAFAWSYGMVFVSGNTIGPMSVAIVSQSLFGYNLANGQSELSPEQQMANAHALRNSILVSSVVPSFISFCILSLLFKTYARDKERAQLQAKSSQDEWEALLGNKHTCTASTTP